MTDFRQPCLHLFDYSPSKNRTAIDWGERDWTYGEFYSLVQSQATSIRWKSGDSDLPRVAIIGEKGMLSYASQFATMLIGGRFCMLSPRSPVSLINYSLSAFEPDVVVCSRHLALELGKVSPRYHYLTEVPEPISILKTTLPSDSHGGYVMFTSGSTGRPKGVHVSSESLSNYLSWSSQSGGFGLGRRVSQHPDLHFDLSILDTITSLVTGSTLVPLVRKQDKHLPRRFACEQQIDTWVSVPSVLGLMAKDSREYATQAQVSNWYFCGEALLESHVDFISTLTPSSQVHNLYGPTEATVSVTQKTVTPDGIQAEDIDEHGVVSAGFPIPNTSIEIDSRTNEVLILGAQVAEGYIGGEPTLANRFFSRDETEVRGYRTGDKGRIADSGLFIEGRLDRQIKRFGYRIELGQIESVLGSRVTGGVVAAIFTHDSRLKLYYEDDSISASEMRAIARELLPDYSIPSDFICVDEIPRNRNDKVDYTLLGKLK